MATWDQLTLPKTWATHSLRNSSMKFYMYLKINTFTSGVMRYLLLVGMYSFFMFHNIWFLKRFFVLFYSQMSFSLNNAIFLRINNCISFFFPKWGFLNLLIFKMKHFQCAHSWNVVSDCARSWNGLFECTRSWSGVFECTRSWNGVTKCARLWNGVSKCGHSWNGALIFAPFPKLKHLIFLIFFIVYFIRTNYNCI